MKRVIIESPYKGNIEKNIKYARACMRDCLKKGEIPLASHLLYTQEGILDDSLEKERNLGIEAGIYWGILADLIVVYTDKGISDGMRKGIERYRYHKIPIEYRKLEE